MTIRELAKILKLSKSTVAYALRGTSLVNEKTRERVLRKAAELGYSPNPVASAFLHQVRSQNAQTYRSNLAFLLAKLKRKSYLSKLIEGAIERAKAKGYGMDVIEVEGYTKPELTRLLIARGVLGVIAGPLHHSVGHVSLDWTRFAAVTYGYSMTRPALHRVVHDHAGGMRALLRMGRKSGYRRIGLAITHDGDLRSDLRWSSAFLGFQGALPLNEQVRPYIEPSTQLVAERVHSWLSEERPDMVILHATDVTEAIKRHLGTIPLAVLDREPGDTVAGIDQRFTLCGNLLVDALCAQIFHNERGIPKDPVISLVQGAWVGHPSFRSIGTRLLVKGRKEPMRSRKKTKAS